MKKELRTTSHNLISDVELLLAWFANTPQQDVLAINKKAN